MKQIVLILALIGASAFATEKGKPKESPIETKCKTAALNKALDKLQEDTGFTDKQMDDLVIADEENVELFFNHGGKIDQANVRLNSADIQEWDGYAEYNVSLRELKASCRAVGKPTLIGSEGI